MQTSRDRFQHSPGGIGVNWLIPVSARFRRHHPVNRGQNRPQFHLPLLSPIIPRQLKHTIQWIPIPGTHHPTTQTLSFPPRKHTRDVPTSPQQDSPVPHPPEPPHMAPSEPHRRGKENAPRKGPKETPGSVARDPRTKEKNCRIDGARTAASRRNSRRDPSAERKMPLSEAV
jgi:hypothetical protein